MPRVHPEFKPLDRDEFRREIAHKISMEIGESPCWTNFCCAADRVFDAIVKQCYEIARGHAEGDGFKLHGTNMMYWKGRSDAAAEIRRLIEDKVFQVEQK